MNSELYISEDESNDGMDECKRDITPNNDQGVLKSILQGGKGKSRPTMGDDVLIHMVGQIQKDGSVYINTRKPENPIRAKVGSQHLPPALNLALQTMKVDEIAMLTCKPEYGYGSKVLPAENRIEKEVPSDSVLIIELHLIDFRFNDCTSRKDGGVIRIRQEDEGNGTVYPVYDSKVKCDLTGYLIADSNQDHDPDATLKADQVFDRRQIEWIVGEAAAVDIPHGVEVAVKCMLKGEQSLFQIRHDYASRGSRLNKNTAPNSIWPLNSEHVLYRIKLLDTENAKEYFELSAEQRLSESIRCKQLGNQYCKDVRLPKQMAIRRFKRAIELLEAAQDMDTFTDEHGEVLFACYLNISKAYLDCGTPELARPNLDQALSMKPNHVKAIYRFACYFMARKMYQEARQQFATVLQLDADNGAARRMLAKCDQAWRRQRVQERLLCQRMFRTQL